MRIEHLMADGEDGQVYHVHKIWAQTTTNPLVGPKRILDGSYEYKLASGEELETVNVTKRIYRTWDGGVLITLQQD